MEPRRTVSPIVRSDGTRPRKAINCCGVANRRTANLRSKGDGDKESHTPERLVGRHHRRHRPARHDLTQLLLQSCQASLRCDDSLKLILENNLLGWVSEGLLRQPTFMHFGPMPATREAPTVAEQE